MSEYSWAILILQILAVSSWFHVLDVKNMSTLVVKSEVIDRTKTLQSICQEIWSEEKGAQKSLTNQPWRKRKDVRQGLSIEMARIICYEDSDGLIAR